jgi:probable F420-dependent oxidoreductase
VLIGCDVPYMQDPGAVRAFAQAAEGLGYDYVAFSEHVASSRRSPFPPRFSFDDPWHESFTMLAFLAAATTRIELTSSMLLLPLRPAVLAAKQAAEVDLLSGGRLRLGVSVGWDHLEMEALGIDPATRGERFDEQVAVMRRLWTEPSVTHDGRFFHLRDVGINPRPGRSIPVWIGAGDFRSGGIPPEAAMRRIVDYADGYKMFAPLGGSFDKGIEVFERLREMCRRSGRRPETLGVEARLITQATPEDGWLEVAQRWSDAGASHLGLGNRRAGGTVDDQIDLVARVMVALSPLGRPKAESAVPDH